ncbi:DUF2007 domain-containing protein [Flavobacterium sp. FBOR7N2.3]|uniref:DUF2007 domain-containing protein n=1 Tax=Flavobacterium magnesitis TaxID=3138077 RepID=A0ABV4TGI8_9FLAO
MEDIFEIVGVYQYSSEAIIFKGKLESEGIEVYMKDNYTIEANPLYSNAVGGVKLLVSKMDYAKAMEIISQVSKYSLDDESQLMKCPNCKAEQIAMFTSIRDLKSLISFIFSTLLLGIPFRTKHKYKCRKCSFEF